MLGLFRSFFAHYQVKSIIFGILGVVIFIALITYSPRDSSFNVQSNMNPQNILGYFGSYLSDIIYQLFGISSFIMPICFLSWSVSLQFKKFMRFALLKNIIMFIVMILTSLLLFTQFIQTNLEYGAIGEVAHHLILKIPNIEKYYNVYSYIGLLSITILLFLFCINISFKIYYIALKKFIYLIYKLFALSITKLVNLMNNSSSSKQRNSLLRSAKIRTTKQHKNKTTSAATNLSLIPSLELLKETNKAKISTLNQSELKELGEELLKALNDFGVKGDIIDIKQGPVVTLYAFEPAPGIKSSRIIGLADDIARSLSSVSARISNIPGRNVLGIELPNKQRAFFSLRELLDTEQYKNNNITIPIILGKDLSGDPFIADLAKMPHLLIAGTTGSGKSVAINVMIISILYKYTTEECKLIMIDPKMLELSVYDNIPHLLTPVVTESAKAVNALKWAVREMENRYRLMSSIGVRNIDGYNAKIKEALEKGTELSYKVHTGFDDELGKPIYETINIKLEKLPYIVIVVDEMADLMILVGKDIEALIQRLAQMARAAGIHLIMATQRPSVDVITGVIKANFPSRVSFKVTSKIDSRTILGEQGAEQLLGMGDMLYMGNASNITRVHCPFIDDNEVSNVTNYLRSTGSPEYVASVTDKVDDDGDDPAPELGQSGGDNQLYNKALNIVLTERKISISYIQRCLRIGYNKAANIVEEMERKGVVSAPSHSGKREILLPKS
ncbi:MAG: DNA translocase FtsK [Rickettsiaceae bacterium]